MLGAHCTIVGRVGRIRGDGKPVEVCANRRRSERQRKVSIEDRLVDWKVSLL